MQKRMLRRISLHARSFITQENYDSLPSGYFSEYVTGFEREVNIEPLITLLGEAMQKFDGTRDDRISSDGWLAPRVHASLRLYRREAGDLKLWEYLSIVIPEVREYILWRWGTDGRVRDIKRIYGEERRHALGRLWWTAELTRNGPDYTSTVQAFAAGEDLINYITDLDYTHNRAGAIAFVRFISEMGEVEDWKKKSSKDIGSAFNHVLTTIMLDHLAPNAGIDLDAYSAWVEQEPDETLMLKDLPEGPNEPQLSDELLQKVLDLLISLEIHAEATS